MEKSVAQPSVISLIGKGYTTQAVSGGAFRMQTNFPSGYALKFGFIVRISVYSIKGEPFIFTQYE